MSPYGRWNWKGGLLLKKSSILFLPLYYDGGWPGSQEFFNVL
jgi:hypothetical protein